jgi:undecaprenyldiphospho-muramoylpentapeptide beta-N-acetylglucosaminyltransferase
VRLLICAGGTGGGVYPALAVLQALPARRPHVETLWVGGEAGMEADLVRRAGVRFASIPAAGLHGVGLRALPGNALRMLSGYAESRRVLREFQPDVLLFTGGYVAGPMAAAGRKTPTLVFVPDIEPGLALKTLARFADRIAVTSAESQKYFRQKVTATGYPVRRDLTKWKRGAARTKLHLSDDLPVVLVAGGSKGARSINEALVAHLPALLELAQVVHVTGRGEWEAVLGATSGLTRAQRRRYHPHPFLYEEMGAAMAASDVAVMRAGASALGELPAFGLPGILVPYPHAWRYQRLNADYLVRENAAVALEDADLQDKLLEAVRDVLGDASKRRAMRGAMRSLAHPQAAKTLAGLLLELGGHRP